MSDEKPNDIDSMKPRIALTFILEYHCADCRNQREKVCLSAAEEFADYAERRESALREELERVKKALVDFRDFGLRYDLHPTRRVYERNTDASRVDGWWNQRMIDADTDLRRRASEALAPKEKP